jgi:hydrogenase expression/formation protein HypD
LIDQAIAIASLTDTIMVSFGDMLRVPGSKKDLFQVRAEGGDVRVVYSPLECLKIAQDNPDKEIVFFGVGFETTAPANAMAILQAKQLGLPNFSMLVSHVRVPPALDALLSAPDVEVQGFLLAGHVCAVMGYWEYPPLAERFRVPMVVTGFEPLDIVQGIRQAVHLLEQSRAVVENAYSRVVVEGGNQPAQAIINTVFEECDRNWRGIGLIPRSGWALRPEFHAYDAARRFAVSHIQTQESPLCHAGEVLKGVLVPTQCPAFGKECTPRRPLGAPMVSSEGACAAYYNFGRFEHAAEAP